MTFSLDSNTLEALGWTSSSPYVIMYAKYLSFEGKGTVGSLEEIAADCERISAGVCITDLCRYALIDRATVLGLLAVRLERLTSGLEAETELTLEDAEGIREDVRAVRYSIHAIASVAHTATESELRQVLLAAQRDLLSACRTVISAVARS